MVVKPKACGVRIKKSVQPFYCFEIRSFGNDSNLHHTNLTFTNPFENIVGKRENTGNQHFLLFPQCFLPYQRQNSQFRDLRYKILLSSANALNLDNSKFFIV